MTFGERNVYFEICPRKCECAWCYKEIKNGEPRAMRYGEPRNEYCHPECMIKLLEHEIKFQETQILSIKNKKDWSDEFKFYDSNKKSKSELFKKALAYSKEQQLKHNNLNNQ